MIVTKAAIVVGVAVFGFLCYLAFAGSAPATGLVVTVVALVVLVGGGNWLGGRSTPERGPAGPPPASAPGVGRPEPGGPDAAAGEPAPGAAPGPRTVAQAEPPAPSTEPPGGAEGRS